LMCLNIFEQVIIRCRTDLSERLRTSFSKFKSFRTSQKGFTATFFQSRAMRVRTQRVDLVKFVKSPTVDVIVHNPLVLRQTVLSVSVRPSVTLSDAFRLISPGLSILMVHGNRLSHYKND